MKMKEIGLGSTSLVPPLDPPMESVSGFFSLSVSLKVNDLTEVILVVFFFLVSHCVDSAAVVRVDSGCFDIRLLLHSNCPCGDGVPGSRGGSQGGGREVRVISPR